MNPLPSSRASIVSGLSILHANHAEDLRELVLMHLRRHPLEPLENEVFLVQSNGMAQWLRLRFAEDEDYGIAAALDMQLPARFLWDAYRAVLGDDAVPDQSPFEKERLKWRLLRLLPECLDDPRFAAPRHYLGTTQDLAKRYQLAERLADLFDQYQVYRADWLEDWAQGRDQLRDARGEGLPLEDKYLWQPELWRRLLADVPDEERHASRAAVHQHFLQALRSGQKPHEALPRRILVFGISSLPQQVLEALDALSRVCQILICVNNPCRYYWADIIEERQLLRFQHHRHVTREDLAEVAPEDLHARVNPLLAAWGKQGRDYIGLLYAYDQARASNEQIDIFRDRLDPEKPRLLHMLQQGILDLAPAPTDPDQRVPVAPDDDSVRFNVAHSRQREVEILQDHLLDLFNREGSDLAPRDIVVMVPDITAYAPHIEAVFGRLDPRDPRYIPYTIADRPERAQSQILIALELLLQLPESRFTTSDLMNLLDIAPFRERFGLRVDSMPTLQRWIQASGIRWGLHASHRAGLELPESLEQNSWRFGLRRMLLGYANGQVAWSGIEPFDEVGGLEAATAGRLARVLEVLDSYWRELSLPRSATEWADIVQRLVEDTLAPIDSEDALVLDRLADVLDQWQEACEQARLEEALPLSVVREAVLSTFQDSGLSQRFLAGRVNFCTLMPMRSIPFRVLCLLGMNDADYPRQRPPLDFDLMAELYRPGDRTRREDDRYLFLEALLSARDQLYISYIGRSERDNSERTPSVLVGQLREHIDAGWRLADGAQMPLSEHLTLEHPLQPFSPTYFKPGRDSRLFTFAREWREVHDSGGAAETDELPPWQPVEPLHLDDLTRFLREPAELFFHERLNVWPREENAVVEEHEPFVLDALQRHLLTRELVERALQADPAERDQVLIATVTGMERRGELPLGAQALRASETLLEPARDVLAHWAQVRTLWPRQLDPLEVRLDIRIPQYGAERNHDPTTCQSQATTCHSRTGGNPASEPPPVQGLQHAEVLIRIEDWLGELYEDAAGGLARIEWYPGKMYAGKDGARAKIKHHYFFGLWVRHLVAALAGLELSSVLVTPDGARRLAPLAREQAEEYMQALLAAWQEGLCRCLPLARRTAFAWLEHRGDDPESIPRQVRDAYEGSYNQQGECTESLALLRCWPSLEDLWGEDFKRLAEAVYGPLHQALQNLEDFEAFAPSMAVDDLGAAGTLAGGSVS